MIEDRLNSIVERLLARDPRAIARAISLIENESVEDAALVGRIYPHTGRAYVIGLTGPPGAGKSTLADRMVTEIRKAGSTVGVLAIDPTSPYTGGALLGDRVRMQVHAEDEGVFIRSMATRGHLGGLARTTSEAALVLDAAGFDYVIIETVGVGQDEVDVVRTADIAIVTVVPGTGDEIQALKAGIMEIADIFVVNKADREGADRSAAAIETMLSLGSWAPGAWKPPVLRTEATTGRGIPELIATIQQFKAAMPDALGERRRARSEWRLREILTRRFIQHVEQRVLQPGEFDRWLDRIARQEIDPYRAAEAIMGKTTSGVVSPSDRAETTPEVVFSIDHIGVAVDDATAMVDFFKQMFGFETDEPEVLEWHRIRFVATGQTTIELVEPMSAESPVARFLAARGPGFHHVCFRVPDIEAALGALKARGARLIDEVARAGAQGSRIAFMHPSTSCGLLIEIKQRST
jgi:LAO/AO transport system kinase